MRSNTITSLIASNSASLGALLIGMTAAMWSCTDAAFAACVTLALPDGPTLAHVRIDDRDPLFRVTYVHSVTRTPVDEVYRVERDRIVETEIRFVEHGPGLPTAPDEGGTFERRDGVFIVRGNRSFETIIMRVHLDQQPTLVAGAQSVRLAQWGNRALAMTARFGTCVTP